MLAVASGTFDAGAKAINDRLREHFGGDANELRHAAAQRLAAPIAAASPRAPSDDIELRDRKLGGDVAADAARAKSE